MIYSPSVSPVSETTIVNTFGAGEGESERNMSRPDVTALTGGGFVVVWVSEGQDGDAGGIFAQRYNENAEQVGSEFRVNTFTQFDQSDPAVTSLPDGGFVVVWTSDRQDGYEGGIFGQRFDANGAPNGAEYQVSSGGPVDQGGADIISFEDGSTFVAWESEVRDSTNGSEIIGRGFSNAGDPISNEFQLNSSNEASQINVSLLALSGSSFAASWHTLASWYHGIDGDIWTRVFPDLENPTNPEILIQPSGVWYITPTDTYTVSGGLADYYVIWSNSYRTGGGPGSSGSEGYTNAQLFGHDGSTTGEIIELGNGIEATSVFVDGIGIQSFLDFDYSFPTAHGTNIEIHSSRTPQNLDQDVIEAQVAFEGALRYNSQNSSALLNNGNLAVAWRNYDNSGVSGNDILFQILRTNEHPTGTVEVSGDSFSGRTITALSLAVDDPDGVGDFQYQWFRGNDSISGAASSNYTLAAEDVGQEIRAQVSFLDGNGVEEIVISDIFGPIGLSLDGTSADDEMGGSEGPDSLRGFDGNDTLIGNGGYDTLDGGAGNDNIVGEGIILGGEGADFIENAGGITEAGAGNDTISATGIIRAGAGNDNVVASLENDEIHGEAGDDQIYGGAGNDQIFGGSGADSILGESGNDIINPGLGVDTISLGEGADLIISSSADLSGDFLLDLSSLDLVTIQNATLFGNPVWEFDGSRTIVSADLTGDGVATFTLFFAGDLQGSGIGMVQSGLDIVISYVTLNGTELNDTITGNAHGNIIRGFGGDDHLIGQGGEDEILGGDGRDTLEGGIGDDLLVGGNGSDRLFGEEGNDTLLGEDGSDFLESGNGNDLLVGENGNDQLRGEEGNDNLDGGDGADILNGGDGNDLLEGGNGNDQLRGEEGNDTLRGGDGTDSLYGGAGNDFILGGETDADLRDIFYGGAGNDTIDGGYGNDELRGDEGNDDIAGGFGADTVIGGTGDDTLTGSSFGDEISGGDGFDFINGGFGHDRVNGGDGADKFFHLGIFDHGSDWIQDYDAAEGDVLLWGGAAATVDDFQINLAHTETPEGERSGDDDVQEAFVIYRPTGQIMWALVDGAGQDEINLQITGSSDVFDLLA